MTLAKNPPTTRRYVSHDPRSLVLISPLAVLQILPRFGLKEGQSWEEVKQRVINLNTSSDRVQGVIYKLVFFGRHGQGFRESVFTANNSARSSHVRQITKRLRSTELMWAPSYPLLCSTLTIFEAWDNFKAKEFADDEFVWGPDPDLTPLGEEQAQSVKDAWIRERQAGIPLPEAMYCSPFHRAIRTCHISFGGWFLPQDVHGSTNGIHPTILEVVSLLPSAMWFFLTIYILQDLRETLGVNTCDSRGPRSKKETEFGPLFKFEPGFVENDELWTRDHRELGEEHDVRTRRALSKIMAADGTCKFLR